MASAAHADAAGKRAYAKLVTPLDLVDWSVDDVGRFLWAVIREDEPDTRMPGEEPEPEVKSQYRVWYRDRWELWRDKSGSQMLGSEPSFELEDTAPHRIGYPRSSTCRVV